MHNLTRTALVALGTLGLAGAAFAQPGPPPKDETDYVSTDPVLSADLDDGGSGNFTAVVHQAKNELCYMLNTPGLADVVAAHIHKGAAGENGAPVVPLEAPSDGASGGCVQVKPEILTAILANPAGYYVNVHTKEQPAGAERGQLVGKPAA